MNDLEKHFSDASMKAPSVFGKDDSKARTDVFSHLAENRVIMLTGLIDRDAEDLIVAQLLFLEMLDPTEDIKMYISSQGGYVRSAFAIYDIMQSIQPDIATYCTGQAMSAASLLLSAGTHGKRNIYPNASIMVHQPSAGAWGKVSDMEIDVAEVKRLQETLLKMYRKHTGQNIRTIKSQWKEDNYMSAKQAIEWGLADNIVKPQRGLKKAPSSPSPKPE